MKKVLPFLFIYLLSITFCYAQTPVAEIYNPPIPLGITNADWGYGDFLVSASEPMGRPSGVYRASNTTLYVAIPDTNILSNKCIVVLKSTNNGVSWTTQGSISPATVIPKLKMVDAGGDSLYCFFIYGTTVYSWNIITNSLNPFTAYTNIRDFDVTASSTHSLYIIVDLNTNNDVRMYGSATYGVSWAGAVYLSSSGALPKITMSGTGDTCLINYYASPFTPDTLYAQIRNVRYRESAPGTLSIVGSFTNPVASGTLKDQFQGVMYGGKSWIFYTSGSTGSIDFNCVQSNDNGTTYGSPFTIGSLPSRDEYWFDAVYYKIGAGGVDILYYSDSVTATPSNTTDRLYYCNITSLNPTVVTSPLQISQHWPFWSSRLYIPSLIEYYNTSGDVGAIWVGGPPPYKLYFDRGGAVTRVNNSQSEIPAVYTLAQNYPNPFNPVTKIDFSIPKYGLVTIKIYDIMGKEVDVLTNKIYTAGNYSIDYNASKLSSGVYFYKLTSGIYSETKKMILIK
jgi:hypothetical protein